MSGNVEISWNLRRTQHAYFVVKFIDYHKESTRNKQCKITFYLHCINIIVHTTKTDITAYFNVNNLHSCAMLLKQ